MAEAIIGIAGGAIAFVQATTLILDGLNKVKDAPKNLQRLCFELKDLEVVLKQIEGNCLPCQPGEPAEKVLRGCVELLKQLHDLVAPFQNAQESSNNKLKHYVQGLRIRPKEGEIENAVARLQSQKLTLSLALMAGVFQKVDQNVDLSVIKRVVDEKINLVTQQLRCEPSSKVEDLLGIDIRQVKDLCNLNIESVQNLKDVLDERIRQEFLESLCTPDYQQDRIEIKVASHTTCEWIRRHAMYKSFRSHPGSRILHVYGNAGSGKSVLAKHVWKGLSSELRSSPKGDMVLLYYCCNARTRPDESAASILRALIHQFLWQKSLAFKNVVQSNELMQSRSISGGSTDWTFSALWSIFKDIVANSQDQVYCIIDGLDECENESMEDLLLLLPSLLKKGNSKAFSKFFLTSRVEGHIVSALEGHAANITITSDVTRHDVEIYVGERLANLTRRLRLNAKEEQNLRRLLAERASGMFLWVDLAIKDLEKTYGIRAKTIARRVRSLPSGLNALYERMLSKIDAMCEDQDTFQLARKMLTWIALAARPLTLNELRIALAMEVDTKDLDSLEPLQNISYDLLGLCGSFVEIIRKSNNDFPVKESQVEADELEDLSATVRLIHQSAKEYLVDSSGIPDSLSKYRINSHMGNAEIARICLTYLLSQNFAVGPIRADSADLTKHTALLIRRLNRFGLLEYVSIHWPTHARDGEREDVNMQVCVFLRDNVNHYRSWHQAHVFVSLLQFIQTFDLTEIHAASTLGLDAVVILLLDQGSDVDAKAGYNQTPLHYAAWKGHMKVLKLLLDRGADIEAEIHGGGRALHLVALRGNMEAIRLLLDRGAKVESSAHSAWTLLHPVVEAGNLELLKLLLDKGANINEWDTRKSTLLHRAAWKGHLDIVRLLLDRGADIQAKNGSDWTALHVAVENGHLEIAQLLLDKGIEVDAKTSQGRTAVHYAARHGHSNLIRTLLLRRQADIAAKTLNGRTVLHIAAQKGHFETVKMILEQRTEVKSETIDEDNFAAFYDALEYSHGPVAEVLLGSVKLDEHGYDMALQAAAYYGLETLVLSLLESHNGSFNCQKVCAQALQIACINGKVAVVNDLISAGANPNQTDEHGWSPVSCALHFQQQAVLDKLLESGADVALAGKNAFLSPTSMNSADSSRRLVFDDDGMTIRYHDSEQDVSPDTKPQAAAVRANNPIPPYTNGFYFEITIVDEGDTSAIGLGVCSKFASLNALPGWRPSAWGYHGHTGEFAERSKAGRSYGPGFGTGDVVGCYINPENRIGFTKNGVSLGDAGDNVTGKLFPVVALRSRGACVQVNFGGEPFQYDVSQLSGCRYEYLIQKYPPEADDSPKMTSLKYMIENVTKPEVE